MKDLAELLFPTESTKNIDYWYKAYPKRNIEPGQEVVRIAPSPTGFLHLGALYLTVVNRRIADDTNGIFLLRIEDTDTSREVEGARDLIVKGFGTFGINFDEGFIDGDTQFGDYGPYLQTQRVDIYKSFAKDLLARGLAYPCFITPEELKELREKQESQKIRPGYYGEYAVWRDASFEKVKERLDKGEPYVIRFRSSGDQNKKRPFKDEFFGDMEVPENDEDFVLLKTNGIPTYHFAHIVDDYLMGTTFVIRANEWLPSIGKHLELWDAFNLPVPKYGHIAPINKQEGSTVRKLSKRKDPEANIMGYIAKGYPTDALIGYLYRLANPSFDDWWQAEKRHSVREFPFSLDEFSQRGRGPLIDINKLNSISSDVISYFSAEELIKHFSAWADMYDVEFSSVVKKDPEYFKNVLNIDRDGENGRKDIFNWSSVKEITAYFFDDLFDVAVVKKEITDSGLETILQEIKEGLDGGLSNDLFYKKETSLEDWVSEMKKIAEDLGFALDKNKFKENKDSYRGDFALFMRLVRLVITGREHSPNLFYIFQVMGKDRVLGRIEQVVNLA